MYLSKILSKSKVPAIPLLAIVIPTIWGVWNFDFQKISPDVTLTSQAIYNIQVGLTTWFLLIVIFLLACILLYSILIVAKENKSLKADLSEILKCIKESTENNYTIHQRNTLSPNIDKAMNEEASKGSNLPQGSLAGRLFDIYLYEVSVYCLMLRDSTLSLARHPEMQFSSPKFIHMFQELLIAHNKRIKNFHNRQITNLFAPSSSTITNRMVEHFSSQADVETKLRYKELLASLNIKNLTSSEEMAFQSWEPVVREKPEPHTYVEEDEK